MNNIQIALPPNIYNAFLFFEKSRDDEWKDNPFIFYKRIYGMSVKIAKNISNLNYYQIDIPINNKIKPSYLLQYLINIDYRNYFSSDKLSFKQIKKINNNKWIEIENYRGTEMKYIVNYNQKEFYLLFYNENWDSDNVNVSQNKYYHCFKILKSIEDNILRFEIILNNMDIDQMIDITVYLEMLINLIKAIHEKFKINYNQLEIETRTSIEIRKHKK
jgi:hypothetical protein